MFIAFALCRDGGAYQHPFVSSHVEIGVFVVVAVGGFSIASTTSVHVSFCAAKENAHCELINPSTHDSRED